MKVTVNCLCFNNHKLSQHIGWMYGEYEGNSGSFPSEYVQPIVGLRATKDAIEVWSQSLVQFH